MNNKRFNAYEFNLSTLEVIQKLGFSKPTDIQHEAIPEILQGKSVIGKSQTGSGKTHAYLLPLMNQLRSGINEVQLVITLPTRELATQIYDEVKKIIKLAEKEDEWTAKLLIGGTDKQRMIRQLKKSPDIIVGTPGRIMDLVNENALSIYSASSFVIDEADLMLDLGFIQTVDQLLVRCQKDIQLLVFSATIPQRLEHFFKKYLDQPIYVKIDDGISPETLEHRLIALKHRDITHIIMDISKVIQPYLAIIFTNGKEKANEIGASIQEKGLNTVILHGGLSPRERKRALKQIQQLQCQYIVATDLASRGIDIKGVSHVINAELPKEEHFYTHRVGRTARAGMEGDVISIYGEQDISLINKLENKGISFIYSEVKNGEWENANPWNKRKMRTDTTTNLDKEAWRYVKKPKKIKPGYKKKMKQQQQSIKKQLQKKTRRNKK
ncbi:DEAD/DEAH box helicase [Virgibacillus sp. W0181]|uniref:DEAD/DEAH box helicase n=1 Tax=Virgibacillus sp. W0181 TaxID=3391581 RepID=UPI003F44F955